MTVPCTDSPLGVVTVNPVSPTLPAIKEEEVLSKAAIAGSSTVTVKVSSHPSARKVMSSLAVPLLSLLAAR